MLGIHHRVSERRPRVRSVAQPEPGARLVVDSAPGKIGARLAAPRALELVLEEAAGPLHDFVERRGPFGRLALFRRGPRHFEPGLARQTLHRFGKREPLLAHHEADHVAMGATAEAVEEALFVADRERGRLLVVKRAKALELAPGALERHMPGYDVAEPDARADLIQEIGRYRHSGSRSPPRDGEAGAANT